MMLFKKATVAVGTGVFRHEVGPGKTEQGFHMTSADQQGIDEEPTLLIVDQWDDERTDLIPVDHSADQIGRLVAIEGDSRISKRRSLGRRSNPACSISESASSLQSLSMFS